MRAVSRSTDVNSCKLLVLEYVHYIGVVFIYLCYKHLFSSHFICIST